MSAADPERHTNTCNRKEGHASQAKDTNHANSFVQLAIASFLFSCRLLIKLANWEANFNAVAHAPSYLLCKLRQLVGCAISDVCAGGRS